MPTFTATPEPAGTPPRIVLDLNMSDVVPVPTQATITRQDPDGRSRPVRLADPASLTSGAATVFDYESPFGQNVTYTATAGSTVITTTAVSLNATDVWLRHPGVPSLSVKVTYQGRGTLSDRSRASSRAVFMPLGRRTPIVVSGLVRSSPESSMTVLTQTDAEARALWSLLDDDAVLLLTIPASRGWGLTYEYVSVGDVTESRAVQSLVEPSRLFTLPYTAVDRPAGGSLATYVWSNVVADHATWADVVTAYATWSDVLANRRV